MVSLAVLQDMAHGESDSVATGSSAGPVVLRSRSVWQSGRRWSIVIALVSGPSSYLHTLWSWQV